jgi:hypothetical protein
MTHILQGLDVVVFSVLKQAWDQARKEYEARTGRGVTKQTFLGVLAVAWMSVMTVELIRAAFAQTGVFPFNSDIITADKLSTSRATTTQLLNMMPLQPTTPVKSLTDRLRTAIDDSALPPIPAPCFDIDDLVDDSEETSFGMANNLLQTSAQFLIDPSQQSPTSDIPPLNLIPPMTPHRRLQKPQAKVQFTCRCFAEDEEGNVGLLDRISELEAENQILRRDVRRLHSHLALTTIFCKRLQTQNEAAKSKTASKKGCKQLNTMKGALLTGNAFMLEVEEHKEEKKKKAGEKVEKARKMADYKLAKDMWDVNNKA